MATESALSDRKKLLRGEETTLQTLEQSNVVRVFISSTFSDMSEERNLLLEKAYPDLRSFCQKLGLDFQAMDMRWGIQDTATVDHSTCELCLMEIRTCKRLSMGPHFVAFIGNRYGYRPLPSNINVEVFEKLLKTAKELGLDNEGLIGLWYKRDDNAVPPVYVLQPITNVYQHFDDQHPANEKKRLSDRAAWDKTSTKLAELLRKYAKVARKSGEITEAEGQAFFKSVTELEIEEGLASLKNIETAYLYRREIKGLEHHLAEKSIRKYLDVDDFGSVDDDAQVLLNQLKSNVEKTIGRSNNVKKYEVEWYKDQGITTASKNHVDYLESFCTDFVKDLKYSIDRTAKKSQQSHAAESDSQHSTGTDDSEWLFEEVLHHASFAQTKTQSFCGRKSLLDDITTLLLSSSNHQPVVVFGKSGRGKTALCAMTVKLCREMAPDDVLVYRFLGTSPNSSHIHNVLQSLILQISEAFELSIPGMHLLQNFNGVVQRFSKLLDTVSDKLNNPEHKGRLLIFLDSLDQLSSQDGAHRMNWLPKNLPPKVHVLLTTLPDPEIAVMTSLRRSMPSANLIEVTCLDDETGREILDTWLARDGRSLNRDQHALVMSAFQSDPKPLFLKLAFDEARHWNSYTDVSNLKFADSARKAISNYFDRLEDTHGSVLVAKSFAYLVGAKNGIAEGELEDLLSLDDEVLNSSYRYWSPPIRNVVRVPPLLWTRLRYDLGGDLVERQAVGHTVLAFYHRQFVEVARERYLTDEVKPVIHGKLADYFSGKWSDGRKKELTLEIWGNKKHKVDRQVASQPLKFADRVYNFRKLDELPFHLTRATRWQELNDSVLCNMTWMLTKINAFAIKDVLDDYTFALDRKHDPGIALIRDALKLAKPTLEFKGGGITNHVCVEMFGRLAYFSDQFPSTIGRMMKEASHILNLDPNPNLIPLSGCFQPPGGSLRTTLIGFSKPVTCLTTTGDDPPLIAAGSGDGLVMVWEVGPDEVVHTVRAHKDSVACLAIRGLRLASGSHDNTIHVINLDTGSSVTTIKEDHTGYDVHASMALSSDGTLLASACGIKINIWNLSSSQCQVTLSHPSNHPLTADVLFSNCGSVIAGYKDGSVMSWSSDKGESKYNVGSNDVESSVRSIQIREGKLFVWRDSGLLVLCDVESGTEIFCSNLREPNVTCVSECGDFVAYGYKNVVEVMKVEGNDLKIIGFIRHHRDVISSLAFDSDGKMVVVGSRDEEITAWKLEDVAAGGGGGASPVCRMKGMGAEVDRLLVVGDVVVSSSSKVFYLKLWNTKQQNLAHEPPTFPFEVGNNAVSSRGKYLAYADNLNSKVKLHDLASKRFGKLISIPVKSRDVEAIDSEQPAVTRVLFSNNSKHIFFATTEGLVVKNENPMFLRQTEHAVQVYEVERGRDIMTMSVSNDDQCLLLTTRGSVGEDRLILMSTYGFLAEYNATVDDKLRVTATCLGDKILGNLQAFLGTESCQVEVLGFRQLDEGSWQVSKLQTLSVHSSPLSCLKLNCSQNILFTGSQGLTRRLWKRQNGLWELLHEIQFTSLLAAGVTCAAFTSDDKYVITGSHERSVKVWSVETGELVAAQYVYATVTGITVTDDERLYVTTKMGYVTIDKLFHGRGQERTIEPKQKSAAPRTERRSAAGKRKNTRSSACSVL